MVSTSAIAVIVVFLIVCVAVLLYFFSSAKSSLSTTMSGTSMQTIAPTSMPTSTNPVNFAYSIWFYVNDWQYKYGETKIIFGRMNSNNFNDNNNLTYQEMLDNSPCPVVTLGDYQNDLSILLDQTPTGSTSTVEVEPVVISNIPLQKWVHLVMSVYGKTMDVYIDGKLVQTSVLIGPANVNTAQNVYVTPCGGFNGWTSNLQYFVTPLNPQQVWSLYQKGYGSGYFSNLVNAYQLTVTVNNNGVPTKTFSI
jgi:hypothetical protein